MNQLRIYRMNHKEYSKQQSAFNATVAVADNKATFAWTDNSGSGDAAGEDEVMLLAYNKDRALPVTWSDNALAIYLGFRGADGKSVSNSVCLQDTPVSGGSGDSGSGSGGDQSENPLG